MLPLGSITDARDLAQLRHALRPILSRHNVRIRLFGSRARGNARLASDIDLALIGETPLPLDELATARQSLEESNIPFRVDLLDYAAVSPALRRSIDREGIEWTV
jgi:predicted nucleotidyltransferase